MTKGPNLFKGSRGVYCILNVKKIFPLFQLTRGDLLGSNLPCFILTALWFFIFSLPVFIYLAFRIQPKGPTS